MIKTPFTPQNSAILLVDHQRATIQWVKSQPAETTVANVRMLARLGSETGIPLLVTSTMESQMGPNLDDIQTLAPEAFASRIKRGAVFNCFRVPEYANAVSALRRKNLILAGLTTDVCVFNTAQGAIDAGYQVQVVADGCGSSSALAADITFARMREIGVTVSVGNQVLTSLFETFDTPQGQKAERIGFEELISRYGK